MSSEVTTGWLGVLLKAPTLGQVKTRLAKTRGPEFALGFARACVLDTWSMSSSLAHLMAELVVAGDAQLPPMNPPPTIHPQVAGDLGERMEAAMRLGLTRAPFAILIGTDSPTLRRDTLIQAAVRLRAGQDCVLGPATDGGFYLIGLRSCETGLLRDLPWSQTNTLEETRVRLSQRGIESELLPPWFDVDDEDGLARLQRELNALPEHIAPHCRRFLSSHKMSST